MIKNQWYAILESTEVKKEPIGVTRLGMKLVIFRNSQGGLACLSDICCHRGASLSIGKIVGNHIQCPFHGLQYNKNGQCTIIPANGKNTPVPPGMKVKAYPCYEKHGFIFIYYADDIPEQLSEPDFFTDIDDTMPQATIRQHWNTHYSRSIENQLDVAHLPFVHYDTIGRTGKTVVDGPGVEWLDKKRMNVYIFNHKDDGSPHKTFNEVPVPDTTKENKLELLLPNLWQNYISKHMRIVGVFAPVDDENTVNYFRVYQDYVRFPILSNIVNYFSKRYARKIALQDKHVVETELPKKPEAHGEHLFMADHAITEFRKKRRELTEEKEKSI